MPIDLIASGGNDGRAVRTVDSGPVDYGAVFAASTLARGLINKTRSEAQPPMRRLPSLINRSRWFVLSPPGLFSVLGFLAVTSPAVIAGADDPKAVDAVKLADIAQSKPIVTPITIAGRSLTDTIHETRSDNRYVRLRAVRSLRPFGNAAAKALAGLLSHDDDAVRYLAAEAIGDLTKQTMQSALATLRKMATNDDSLSVQMAAAYAMCQAGEVDEFLPILNKRLTYPERGMVCSAAMLIGKIGPDAKGSIETLQDVYKNNQPKTPGDYHKGGAAKNALRKLGAIQ